jgi:hypothetical protein
MKLPAISLTTSHACMILLLACQPASNLEPGATHVSDLDGMEMVHVLAGPFVMGSDSADPDADPTRCLNTRSGQAEPEQPARTGKVRAGTERG